MKARELREFLEDVPDDTVVFIKSGKYWIGNLGLEKNVAQVRKERNDLPYVAICDSQTELGVLGCNYNRLVKKLSRLVQEHLHYLEPDVRSRYLTE